MKRALLKKRFGIPAALPILLALTGVAAACVVATFTHRVTTVEPLSFNETDGILDITYQGDSDSVTVAAKNYSDETAYGIFVDAAAVHVESITYSGTAGRLVSTEQNDGDYYNDGDVWDAKYNIGTDETIEIIVTVDSADNVAPGDLVVELKFQRESEYV